MTITPREQLPTLRSRQTQAAIDAAARAVIARKGILATWSDICELPIALTTRMVKHAQGEGFCTDDDPHLVAVALVSMLNQFCYTRLSGENATDTLDDEACITTLANIFYRTIYHKETGRA
jgi:hypothetical protein